MRRGLPMVLVALAAIFFAGCDGDDEKSQDHVVIHDLGQDNTGPYGVVAVDNHFHDIHPADHIEIAADRTFFVRNEGHNLHNFTIAGTDISEDLRPGDRFTMKPIGDFLEPGTYKVFCKYHADRGMTGEFTVVEP